MFLDGIAGFDLVVRDSDIHWRGSFPEKASAAGLGGVPRYVNSQR
jgi:hypothetical protein